MAGMVVVEEAAVVQVVQVVWAAVLVQFLGSRHRHRKNE